MKMLLASHTTFSCLHAGKMFDYRSIGFSFRKPWYRFIRAVAAEASILTVAQLVRIIETRAIASLGRGGPDAAVATASARGTPRDLSPPNAYSPATLERRKQGSGYTPGRVWVPTGTGGSEGAYDNEISDVDEPKGNGKWGGWPRLARKRKKSAAR